MNINSYFHNIEACIVEKFGSQTCNTEELLLVSKRNFQHPIFKNKSFYIRLSNSFVKGEITEDNYCTTLLYAACKDLKGFQIINASNLHLHRENILKAFSPEFGENEITQFLNQFNLEDDCIFSISYEEASELSKIVITSSNIYFTPQNQLYILTIASVKKIFSIADKTRFFPIQLDCVHGLSPEEDFSDPEKRPIFIPHPAIENPQSIHYIPTYHDGLGIYLHDLIYHALYVQCRIPPKHRQLYIQLAQYLKKDLPQISTSLKDLNFTEYLKINSERNKYETLSKVFAYTLNNFIYSEACGTIGIGSPKHIQLKNRTLTFLKEKEQELRDAEILMEDIHEQMNYFSQFQKYF